MAAYCNLSIAYFKSHDFEEAAIPLEQASKLNPGYVAAFNELSNACAYSNRYEDAVIAFK